jgi:hypothetical protein
MIQLVITIIQALAPITAELSINIPPSTLALVAAVSLTPSDTTMLLQLNTNV